ncbi:MAG: hypothetical protein J5654_09690 [Victivallales bacterium]|nr:hypothetical protein [Victivallales bacterium]
MRKAITLERERTKRVMLDVSKMLEKAAVDRAPVDEGNLVSSIASRVEAFKRSYAAVVYVASNQHTSAYAIPMHEHFYNLGKNSQEKQNKLPGIVVGRRYLARAVEESKQEIVEMVQEALQL